MKMKNFTIIPNELLSKSQLSLKARHLLCVLLKYCGNDEHCYPSQETLGVNLNCSARHIRNLLKELKDSKLIHKTRSGFNKSNTYQVAKSFITNRNSGSTHIGSKFPLHQGSSVPANITYRKAKENTNMLKALDKARKELTTKGILKKERLGCNL